MDNSALLDSLFQNSRIKLHRGKIFDYSLPPKPAEFPFSKIEGMLIGVALGDSLGNTTEGMLPSHRKSMFNEITNYLPHRHYPDIRGYPSDDTQLTFWTMDELLQSDGLFPEDLARRFCQHRIFGIGSTVRHFISNFKSGKSWEHCGPESAGNGALMRVSPIVIPYLKTGGHGMITDTALCAMVTHNDALSTSGCLLLNYLIWQLLDLKSNPAPQWWINQIEHVSDLVTSGNYPVRGGTYGGAKVKPWDFIQHNLISTLEENLSTQEAFRIWWSGAYALETIPCFLYIMMKHGDDPEQAVIRAVNDTKDNDTIASIIGALAGALHGKDSFPKRWMDNLSGKTRHDDDGKICELIMMAKQRWWDA